MSVLGKSHQNDCSSPESLCDVIRSPEKNGIVMETAENEKVAAPDDVKAEIAKHAGNWLSLLQLSAITKEHSGTIRNACKVSFIRSNHSICPMMSNTPACPPADIRKVLTV